MTFTNETNDRLFTRAGALRDMLADACGDDSFADSGLICPDADLDFRPDDFGVADAFDVVDEMRPELPNLRSLWRDDDGTRVTLLAETGETLRLSYTVIELGHRSGRTRAGGAGWAIEAFGADGSPVPVGVSKLGSAAAMTKTVKTAEGLRKTVARMFAGWVTDEMRRARTRKRDQLKRLTEKNRAKAIAWLEDLHWALASGDRESHRGDLDGYHWLDGFDEPELAYAVVRYRINGRDVLRVMWLDLTCLGDGAEDLKGCRVDSSDAAEFIGDAGVRAILDWDDENRESFGGTPA
ncbi:hypothetical protein [Corynebacterium freneyi]|uniref:Uncharacterized protein n=1 Tax=Corynebacterium freneyi TaxID=134034 RepID=A0ABS4U5D3_9CORY|nr:hypothetical protein [Corynebacterium freneyi]MBP2331863.1 hypothetical protein [Corynebacterium freneyi]QXA53863.1 hypothetical protein I6L56_05925 [Corynebacterium freneyi]WJZ06016.1 hypothetical protein CFREN_10340 [Corynebacterium freneyi]